MDWLRRGLSSESEGDTTEVGAEQAREARSQAAGSQGPKQHHGTTSWYDVSGQQSLYSHLGSIHNVL